MLVRLLGEHLNEGSCECLVGIWKLNQAHEARSVRVKSGKRKNHEKNKMPRIHWLDAKKKREYYEIVINQQRVYGAEGSLVLHFEILGEEMRF